MIGDRRMLFERRITVYTEISRLGELEVGAPVRVAGAVPQTEGLVGGVFLNIGTGTD
jgi:hypothetical protein